MGEEFSKKALERHRKEGKRLKCKQCVAAAEQIERENAAKRKVVDDNSDETRKCAACAQVLPKASFNRNQYSKGDGKSRERVPPVVCTLRRCGIPETEVLSRVCAVTSGRR